MGIRPVSEPRGRGRGLLLCLHTPKAHLSWSYAGTQSTERLTYTGPGTQGPPSLTRKAQGMRVGR